jgi:hypothetical protein
MCHYLHKIKLLQRIKARAQFELSNYREFFGIRTEYRSETISVVANVLKIENEEAPFFYSASNTPKQIEICFGGVYIKK